MDEVFAIAPASARPLWFLGGVSAFILALALLLLFIAWSSRHARVRIAGPDLVLSGDLWGRTIPLAALELERARVVDLERVRELTPRRRTLGTALPGYAAGWFRLQSGEKALVYLTRREGVVYVPTRDGYSLLLSAERPEELLTALRSGRTGGRAREGG